MTVKGKCRRCGAEDENDTPQMLKYHFHHKVGCGMKVGPIEFVTKIAAAPKAAEQETPLAEPIAETPIEKPKRAKKAPKKKAEE